MMDAHCNGFNSGLAEASRLLLLKVICGGTFPLPGYLGSPMLNSGNIFFLSNRKKKMTIKKRRKKRLIKNIDVESTYASNGLPNNNLGRSKNIESYILL